MVVGLATWLTGKEAADHLRVSRPTFYRLVKEGQITPYTIPSVSDPRYSKEELDGMLLPLRRGFATAVDAGYAVVFSPEGERHTWFLNRKPVAGNRTGMGSWVEGFRFESDRNSPWDEQVAAAKRAAAAFLQLPSIDDSTGIAPAISGSLNDDQPVRKLREQ